MDCFVHALSTLDIFRESKSSVHGGGSQEKLESLYTQSKDNANPFLTLFAVLRLGFYVPCLFFHHPTTMIPAGVGDGNYGEVGQVSGGLEGYGHR